MAGDCHNFAESSEQNGTVPLSEAILLHALSNQTMNEQFSLGRCPQLLRE